jgi:protein TonB
MSRTDYGSLLSAEITRHKIYPAAARAAGVTGSVVVVLVVGPSGRIVSHTIARSSGSAVLDGEVDAMMAAVQAPPPPGGTFRGGLTINFNLQ